MHKTWGGQKGNSEGNDWGKLVREVKITFVAATMCLLMLVIYKILCFKSNEGSFSTHSPTMVHEGEGSSYDSWI